MIMEFQYFVVTVLLFSGFQTFTATPLCTYQDFDDKFDQPNINFNPLTEEELDDMCRNLGPTLDGFVTYLRQCRNTEVGKSLRLYEITKETLDDLCTSSKPLRTKYLKSVKCLMVENDLGSDCGEVTQSLNYNEGGNCRTGYMLHGCMLKTALDKCGQDGLDVMKAIGRAALHMVETQCCAQTQPHSDDTIHLSPQSV